MVENTRRNPKMLYGEYSCPGRKLQAGDSDVVLITASQPLDAVFPDWIQRSKLTKTEFQPYDINFPQKIPRREFFKAAFEADAPLSQFGQHSAQVIGRQLVNCNFHPTSVYTAPSLKCLESASWIASSFKTRPEICIEPGLWGEYHKVESAYLITPEQAKKDIGLPINRSYEPQIPLGIVDKCPDWTQWQKRCVKTFKAILEKEDRHAIFVLDPVAMKTLSAFCIYGGYFGFKTDKDFLNTSSIPHGSCLMFERTQKDKFLLPENLFPNYTTSKFSTKFNFDKLHEEVVVLDK